MIEWRDNKPADRLPDGYKRKVFMILFIGVIAIVIFSILGTYLIIGSLLNATIILVILGFVVVIFASVAFIIFHGENNMAIEVAIDEKSLMWRVHGGKSYVIPLNKIQSVDLWCDKLVSVCNQKIYCITYVPGNMLTIRSILLNDENAKQLSTRLDSPVEDFKRNHSS